MGKTREAFAGGDDGWGEEVVRRVERKVPVSHLSVWPRVATEETCMTMWEVWVALGLVGMVLRMFLRPGQPQRVEVAGSLARRFSLLGVLAIRAAWMLLKSWCLSWDVSGPVLGCPYARR